MRSDELPAVDVNSDTGGGGGCFFVLPPLAFRDGRFSESALREIRQQAAPEIGAPGGGER
tara:strand:- start:3287 stop:3466 length:180 start_codon:yes stop_codon:yes gene_type:complete